MGTDPVDAETRLRDAASKLARASDALTKVAGTSAVELVPATADTASALDEDELRRALSEYRAARIEYAAALTATGRRAPADIRPEVPEQAGPERHDEPTGQ